MKINTSIDTPLLLKNMLMSLGGLMTFYILFTTRDSRIVSKIFGRSLTHHPYSLTLLCKPNEQISVTGAVLTRRRRFRRPENLPPLSRRLL